MLSVGHETLMRKSSTYKLLYMRWLTNVRDQRSYSEFMNEEFSIDSTYIKSNSIIFNSEYEYTLFLLKWS